MGLEGANNICRPHVPGIPLHTLGPAAHILQGGYRSCIIFEGVATVVATVAVQAGNRARTCCGLPHCRRKMRSGTC